MKRTEFVQVVNDVANAERKRIADEIQGAVEQADKDALTSLIAEIATQIPIAAARTCAQILEQSGIAVFDD